jgi:hypothetical protein
MISKKKGWVFLPPNQFIAQKCVSSNVTRQDTIECLYTGTFYSTRKSVF